MKYLHGVWMRIGTFAGLALLACPVAAAGEAVSVVPRPVEVKPSEGVFRLSPETRIVTDAGVVEVAEYARELFSPATGFAIPVERAGEGQAGEAAGKNCIRLRLAPPSEKTGDEGYSLRVEPDRVVITAADRAGVFYGVQTLRQLLPPAIELRKPAASGTTWEIPCVAIEDRPRFAWRGYMLDCSRTFWRKEYVMQTIRMMALFKLNRLHLHLSDDQGWRLEIKKYPKLTEFGSKFAPRDNQRPEWQGYYTQADMREIIECGRRHGVVIVPEINMPGHALALLACYPELSCAGGPFEILHYTKSRDILKDVCCVGNEKTFEVLEDVLAELAALFPGEYVHTGGDEVPKHRWHACPKCQARMKKEGLKNEQELQSYFTKRIEKFLSGKGKRLIGWDEILEGGLAPDATVMSWRGPRSGIMAARAGHDAVMTSRNYLYFNYWRAPTKQVYSNDPVPAELTPEQAKHILGVQACFWSHSVRTEDGVDGHIFPRLLATAEVGWTPKELRDAESFRSRAKAQFTRFDCLGVNYDRDAWVLGKDVARPKKP